MIAIVSRDRRKCLAPLTIVYRETALESVELGALARARAGAGIVGARRETESQYETASAAVCKRWRGGAIVDLLKSTVSVLAPGRFNFERRVQIFVGRVQYINPGPQISICRNFHPPIN